MRLPTLLLALGLLACPGAAGAAEDTVTHVVFEPGRFAAITAPVVLRYRFEVQGKNAEPSPPSPAQVEVRSIDAEGVKEVWLDLFEGKARRHFGPVAAREQNPILLTLLQMDVNEMAALTGGAAVYFQQQIRQAFSQPAETQPVTVELDGKSLAATRITMHPFRDDPNIGRFPAFRDKTYELTVSDEVPGGLWQLVTRVPDPKTGELLLEKTLTFEATAPAG